MAMYKKFMAMFQIGSRRDNFVGETLNGGEICTCSCFGTIMANLRQEPVCFLQHAGAFDICLQDAIADFLLEFRFRPQIQRWK